MPQSFLPAQLPVMWGLKGLSRDRRHYCNPAQKKGDNNSSKGSEDEMLVYVNHLLLGRCLSLLSPIPVLVLMNLLCTNEDIKGQRGYLRT